jgi:hypothetical protein
MIAAVCPPLMRITAMPARPAPLARAKIVASADGKAP